MGDDPRGYWRLLLASAAAGWLVFLAANYAVDAYGVLGSPWLPRPAEPEERFLKVRFLEADRDYDSFLVGNSRVGTIRTEDVDRAFPDARAYNFTMSQANGWDAERIGAWLMRTRHVRRLFVQADYPETAGPDKPGFALLTAQPPEITGESALAFRARYLVTFSQRAFLEKLRVNWGSEAPLDYSLRTGSWSRPGADARIERDCAAYVRGEPSFAKRVRPAPSTPLKRRVIDADLASLARLVAQARAAHVDVILFVPPRHRAALDAISIDDYAYFLERLAGVAPYLNFGFYSPIALDDCNYYESSHFRPVVGTEVARLLAGRPAHSATVRLVDAGNVKDEVAFVRANFAAFRAR